MVCQHAAIEDVDDDEILPDDCLQMLAVMPPSEGELARPSSSGFVFLILCAGVRSVMSVFTMAGLPAEQVEEKAKKYGPAILEIFATNVTSPPAVDESR
jgi:hypothetical protein